MMRSACARSVLAVLRSQQALLHRLGPEQAGCLPLGFDFAPQFNRDNHGSRFTKLVGDDLESRAFHAFSIPGTVALASGCITAAWSAINA